MRKKSRPLGHCSFWIVRVCGVALRGGLGERLGAARRPTGIAFTHIDGNRRESGKERYVVPHI
ncbi:hypothetical protein A8990_13919 [Paenibacillus taihuensis]|uniref:Uncharacterized protein n=1 Tax=Paenibacillus taihuensis TaxID=1156355 RepID=A0A3D9QUW2_9BACL|nr:hypothetical protein A8990_13919 [Paenibacillus taihuensis]